MNRKALSSDSPQQKLARRLRRELLTGGLPFLNARDLVDPIADCIQAVNQNAEFVVMIGDPRDRRNMSIRTTLHEPTKGTFLRSLIQGLWPADEDRPIRPQETVRAIEENQE